MYVPERNNVYQSALSVHPLGMGQAEPAQLTPTPNNKSHTSLPLLMPSRRDSTPSHVTLYNVQYCVARDPRSMSRSAQAAAGPSCPSSMRWLAVVAVALAAPASAVFQGGEQNKRLVLNVNFETAKDYDITSAYAVRGWNTTEGHM